MVVFLQVERVKAVYECRYQNFLRCVILLGIKRCILAMFAQNYTYQMPVIRARVEY